MLSHFGLAKLGSVPKQIHKQRLLQINDSPENLPGAEHSHTVFDLLCCTEKGNNHGY